MKENDHIILGIDPGTNIMGYALLETHLHNSEIITLNVLKINKLQNHTEKLHAIFEKTLELVKQYHPDILAVEEPFYGKNPQSMLKLGRAQGVVIGACLHAGLQVFEYSPRRIKQAITGKGTASKIQVAAMLHNMYSFENETAYLDATDALAAAVCHHLQSRIDFGTGKVNSWEAFISQNQDRIIQ